MPLEFLTQQVLGGARNLHFLTSSQVRLMLLGLRTGFVNHLWNACLLVLLKWSKWGEMNMMTRENWFPSLPDKVKEKKYRKNIKAI